MRHFSSHLPTPYLYILLSLCLPLSAQDTRGHLTFSFDDVPLAEAVVALRRQYDLPVMYKSGLLDDARVSASCNACTPREALDSLLADQPFDYRAYGTQYVLRRGRVKLGSIQGRVVQREVGSSVPHAMVTLELAGRRQAVGYCDADGYFAFKRLKPGRYTVLLSSTVFSNKAVEDLDLSGGQALRDVVIEVDALSMAPEKMVVRDDAQALRHHPTKQDHVQRSPFRGFQGTPGSAFTSLRRLPGVAAYDWSSADINVQGSASQDTAVYLDGALIEAPAHFSASGLSSQGLIDTDTIDRMELLSGGLPIEYGDRMGGVVTMTTAAPRRKLEASFSASTLESKASAAGTFAEGRGSWFFNYRRGYWDLADSFRRTPGTASAEKDAGNSDMMGKVQYFFNDSHLLSVHLLEGNSDFSLSDGGLPVTRPTSTDLSSHEENRTVWANLKSFWTADLWSETVVSFAGYKSTYAYDYLVPALYQRQVADQRRNRRETLRQDWTWDRGKHQWKWGFRARKSYAYFDHEDEAEYLYRAQQPEPGALRAAKRTDRDDIAETGGGGGTGPVGGSGGSRPEDGYYKLENKVGVDSREYGFYLADRLQVTERLDIETALRYDEQSHTLDHQWSPRFNLSYDHGDKTAFRLNWGRFYQSQALHQLDIGHRETTYSPAELAEHAVAGMDHRFSDSFTLSTEIYRKQYSSLRDRRFDFSRSFLDEDAFEEGSAALLQPNGGRAFGLSFSLHGKHGGRLLDWNLNYTLSRAEDEINGEMVPRQWDQRHAVNAVLNYHYRDSLTLSASWAWHSGSPTTDVWLETVEAADGTREVALVHGPLNASTLPDYQRLDVRLDQRVALGTNQRFFWYMEVTNLLDNRNITGYDYSVNVDLFNNYQLAAEPRDWDRRLPIIGLRWEF